MLACSSVIRLNPESHPDPKHCSGAADCFDIAVVQEILEVANYLALPDIVSLCSAHMRANMDLDNALEVEFKQKISLARFSQAVLWNRIRRIRTLCF
jgi:hypothetical protein